MAGVSANLGQPKLTLDALRMALMQRRPEPGLIHHSDQGSQYPSAAYQRLLKSWGVQVSMSGTGNCYDNVPMESFFGTLKGELVEHARYQARAEAQSDIFGYLEVFYNRQRIHSTIGYVSPLTYEQAFHQRASSALPSCP